MPLEPAPPQPGFRTVGMPPAPYPQPPASKAAVAADAFILLAIAAGAVSTIWLAYAHRSRIAGAALDIAARALRAIRRARASGANIAREIDRRASR